MKRIFIILLCILCMLICSCNRDVFEMSERNEVFNNEIGKKSIDPYDVLKVSKENVRNVSNYYVKRNNNYYSIGNNIELSKAISYNVGYKWGYAQDYAITHIQYYNERDKLNSITTIGDIPIFRIKPEDEIITFDITKILLRPAKYAAHTYKLYCNDMFGNKNNLSIVLNPNRIEEFPIYSINKFIISSEGKDEEIDQKMISSRFTIAANENKKAIVSFFTGTTYHEYNMIADSIVYFIEDEEYEIEGELHKEGYASYDISTIPDGLYYINYGRFGGLFYKGESLS